MKFNLFIGRYQSPHKGHMHIFETYLKKGMPVLIAIRDVETNADNPLTGFQIKAIWEKIYANNPLVQVIIIPDISSVNYGRQVGYEVNEINVDANLASISATEIRKQILIGENTWKSSVDESVHEMLTDFISSKK